MIKSEIIKRLKLKGYKAELEVITKNNAAFIAVRMMLNERLGVYIYIDDLLDGNYSIDYIVDKVIEKYNKALKADDLDIDCFADRDYILDNLYKGVQQAGKEEIIKDFTTDLPGLEIYLYVRHSKNGVIYSSKVTSKMLETFGISVTEAWGLAEIHSNEEAEYKSLAKILNIEEYEDNIMYVLSNKSRFRGASSILNRNLLIKLAKELDTDKIIAIPSSIHEFLIMGYSEDIDIKDINKMIKEVNSEILPEEILGDKAFILNV